MRAISFQDQTKSETFTFLSGKKGKILQTLSDEVSRVVNVCLFSQSRLEDSNLI